MGLIMKFIVSFFILILFVSLPVNANKDLYKFDDESTRIRYKEITKQLRCPKCQNQDIADSNSPISSDMRREVHRLLLDGKTDSEVVDFMVERFGEFVTYKPKIQSSTYLLWFGPWIFVIFGLLLIGLLIRSRSGDNDKEDHESLDSKNHKNVEDLLSQYSTNKEKNK